MTQAFKAQSSDLTIRHITGYTNGISIAECINKLADLSGMFVGDPLYLFRATLLQDHTNRMVLMSFPNDRVQKDWLVAEQTNLMDCYYPWLAGM